MPASQVVLTIPRGARIKRDQESDLPAEASCLYVNPLQCLACDSLWWEGPDFPKHRFIELESRIGGVPPRRRLGVHARLVGKEVQMEEDPSQRQRRDATREAGERHAQLRARGEQVLVAHLGCDNLLRRPLEEGVTHIGPQPIRI